MADSMRDIKRRIKSVTSTKQITHAMQLVASAKLRNARMKADARRAYTNYVIETIKTVREINPEIMVLQGAGISNGQDVYNTIISGADATGSSSGIAKAEDRAAMVDEMIGACRAAWDKAHA